MKWVYRMDPRDGSVRSDDTDSVRHMGHTESVGRMGLGRVMDTGCSHRYSGHAGPRRPAKARVSVMSRWLRLVILASGYLDMPQSMLAS